MSFNQGPTKAHPGVRISVRFPSGDPEKLTTSISPASALSNGTLFVSRGSRVSFNCSTSSGSSRQLAWSFRGAGAANGSLVSISGPWLGFRIAAVQPDDQGLYVCRSLDSIGQQEVKASSELLVYCEYRTFEGDDNRSRLITGARVLGRRLGQTPRVYVEPGAGPFSCSL